MYDGQLEMSFGQGGRLSSRRERRHSRAQWWFERMRRIVERATDWDPAPPPRPVQIWFPAAPARTVGQNVGVDTVGRSDERQVCE